MLHVLLANEGVIDSEAATVIEGRVQVRRTHNLAVSVLMAAFRNGRLRLQVLNDNGVARAHLEAINLNAPAEEDLNSLLIAHLDVWLHCEALSVPEVVEVALADPLVNLLRVELVLGT